MAIVVIAGIARVTLVESSWKREQRRKTAAANDRRLILSLIRFLTSFLFRLRTGFQMVTEMKVGAGIDARQAAAKGHKFHGCDQRAE